MAVIMSSLCRITFLILTLSASHSQAAVCSPDALSSQHHVSVGWGGKYIKLTGTDETTSNYLLANIDQNDCDRFLIEATFYTCPGVYGEFMSFASVKELSGGASFYLADHDGEPSNTNSNYVDTEEKLSTSCQNDADGGCLFEVGFGASYSQLTSIYSRKSSSYLVPITTDIKYSGSAHSWIFWPYITRSATNFQQTTSVVAAFDGTSCKRKKRQAKLRVGILRSSSCSASTTYYVFVKWLSSSNGQLSLSTHSSSSPFTTTESLKFEVLAWRLYSGITNNGTIITGKAIVLRKMVSESFPNGIEDYIAFPTEQGIINQNLTRCVLGSPSVQNCFDYDKMLLKRYNQIERNAGSRIFPIDIEDQHIVDERFFEVIEESSYFRLRSPLHPGKYVAMLKESAGDYSLVVTDFTTQFSDILKFDFRMDVPDVLPIIPYNKLPRMPCPSSLQHIWLPQQHLIQCVNASSAP